MLCAVQVRVGGTVGVHLLFSCFSLVENVMEKERVGTVKMLTPLIDQLASSCSHNGGKVLINVLQTLSQTLT